MGGPQAYVNGVDVATRRQLDLASVLVELSELGPPSEIRRQAPAVAARALPLTRVLLASLRGGALIAEGLHLGSPAEERAMLAELRSSPVTLEYPLVEGEIVRRRRPQLIHAAEHAAAMHAFAGTLGWHAYVAAPVVIDGRVTGILQGDREAPALSDADASALSAFATAFALVFERAALRMRLRAQQEEMRRIATWADARTAELGERPVVLAADELAAEAPPAVARPPGSGQDQLRELLTRRELEVLELLVRGDTNASIARELVLSTGTVKFHVKNVLRKLHAANRAEATSRYLRLTLNR